MADVEALAALLRPRKCCVTLSLTDHGWHAYWWHGPVPDDARAPTVAAALEAVLRAVAPGEAVQLTLPRSEP